MPIRFRCIHCGQLSAISHKMAGTDVVCPTCGEQTPVPAEEEVNQLEKVTTSQPTRQTDEDEGGFILRSRQSNFEEMDLTPMVDVTFLLLIFFMITASFSLQKTLAFPPPNPDDKGARQAIQTLDDFKQQSIIVEIDNQSVIYIDDEPLSDPRELTNALQQVSRQNQKFELLIDAHPLARHETVVQVVDAANETGLQKIRLAAIRPSND